ncbi:MAG: ABC transporter permease [Bacteroidetes bacterium]|jgi:putative ABC transport system permease protein|nr:ABC transporter permease [Bacteroidota bacterium]
MERLFEILESIKTNRLRTFLTGFSVAWGIFMLVILLGLGNGLQNGTKEKFKGSAINSIFISPGQTSISHEGLLPGRKIKFRNEDYDLMKKEIAGIDKISARVAKWRTFLVSYKDKSAGYRVRGVHPDHQFVEKTDIVSGRYVNESDLKDNRKVCVISKVIQTELFGEQAAIGEWLSLSGTQVKVVGIFEDAGSEGENGVLYMPISTAQLAFGRADKIDRIVFTTGDATLEETQAMADKALDLMSEKYHFSKDDPRAVRIRNNYESYKRIAGTIDIMKSFFWLIGVFTIIAGIIGVSNIMLITVQERTKEIGIRKSIGATPLSVVSIIVQESLLITGLFGYIGLFMGVFLLELVAKFLPSTGAVISNPTVDFQTAIIALVVLIVAGGLAALRPSMKAAQIKPVVALAAD